MPKLVSKECPGCHTTTSVAVSLDQYTEYMSSDRRHIQHILPHLSDDLRERFISGYCSDCWNDLFEGYDDDD